MVAMFINFKDWWNRLTNLVNKYRRDKISKEEKKNVKNLQIQEQATGGYTWWNQTFIATRWIVEKNLLKSVLIEYGLQQWNEEKQWLNIFFEELEQFHIEKRALGKPFDFYKQQYSNGLNQQQKNCCITKMKIRETVINVSMFPMN